MSNDSFTEQAARRIARLSERCKDPGFRASLRHWLSATARPRSYQSLMELRGSLEDSDFNTVAALFAYHPMHHDNSGDVGKICRKLAVGFNTFEGRFKRLLLCDAEEIQEHLRPIILAARAKKVEVDYLQLYLDLRSWGHDFFGDEVRRRWAEGFWSEQPEESSAKASEVVS